jgi:MT0933-like antitoxin protein
VIPLRSHATSFHDPTTTNDVAVAKPGSLGEVFLGRWSTMDTEGFRDRADEALTQGEEEVDERTGGRFDEQTDRAAEEVRERGGSLFGDQPADEAQQEGDSQP